MIAARRQIFGLAILIGIVILVSWLMTLAGRHRLEIARIDAMAAETKEAELAYRLTTIDMQKSDGVALFGDDVWSGLDEARVENAQQQALVELATKAGLRILSFGAAPGRPNVGRSTQAYEIEVEGDHADIAGLLLSIELHQPRLAISYLSLRHLPIMDPQTASPVNLHVTVWGFSAATQVQP